MRNWVNYYVFSAVFAEYPALHWKLTAKGIFTRFHSLGYAIKRSSKTRILYGDISRERQQLMIKNEDKTVKLVRDPKGPLNGKSQHKMPSWPSVITRYR